jgi:hypothetical protein
MAVLSGCCLEDLQRPVQPSDRTKKPDRRGRVVEVRARHHARVAIFRIFPLNGDRMIEYDVVI